MAIFPKELRSQARELLDKEIDPDLYVQLFDKYGSPIFDEFKLFTDTNGFIPIDGFFGYGEMPDTPEGCSIGLKVGIIRRALMFCVEAGVA